MRKSWVEYFFSILNTVAERSTCDRGKCGCIIVDENNCIVSTGYVGSLPGFKHCDQVGHELKLVKHSNGTETEHCVRTIHAEQNAVCQAARAGRSLDGTVAYSTICPCRVCAQILITSGIKTVLFQNYYAVHEGLLLLLQSNVRVYDYNSKTKEVTNISTLYTEETLVNHKTPDEFVFEYNEKYRQLRPHIKQQEDVKNGIQTVSGTSD